MGVAESLLSKDTSGVYIPQDGETEQPDERTRNFIVLRSDSGMVRVAGGVGPINYKVDPFNDSEPYKNIALEVLLTPGEEWDAACESNGYQVRFWQSRQISGKRVRYIAEFRRARKWFRMAPLGMMWQNGAGQRQLISRPVAGITPIIDNDNYRVTWANCFGPGIHFGYILRPDELVKVVRIDNKADLPTPTISTQGLKLTLIMGLSWHSQSSAGNGFASSISPEELPNDYSRGSIDEELADPDPFPYRDKSGRETWWLQRPRAWDSADEPHSVSLEFRLRRRGNRIFAALSVPATALNSPLAVYPVFMDTDITEEQVGAGNDDAYRKAVPGIYYPTGSKLHCGYSNSTNYRLSTGAIFRNIPIPQGAIIGSGAILFKASNNAYVTTVNSLLRAYAADDCPGNLSTQAKWLAIFPGSLTTEAVNWDNIGRWYIDHWYPSPNIGPVIQAIVDRLGWVSLNAILVFWDDEDARSSARRRAWAYENSPADAPRLDVSYWVPSDQLGRVQIPMEELAGRIPGGNTTYSGNAADAYPAMTQFPNLEQSAAILVQAWGNALAFKLSADGVNYQDEEEIHPGRGSGSWFRRASARGIAVKNKNAGYVARYQIVVFV